MRNARYARTEKLRALVIFRLYLAILNLEALPLTCPRRTAILALLLRTIATAESRSSQYKAIYRRIRALVIRYDRALRPTHQGRRQQPTSLRVRFLTTYRRPRP